MRLGGPVFQPYDDPDSWIAALKRAGYRAAYCPVGTDADETTVCAYVDAAARAGIVVAEVGAWSNPLSTDPATRQAAIQKCQEQLALADRIGARCCVNISGSRGAVWDGPHPDNLTQDTFDLIVETVRTIVDAIKPRRTFYTLEPMPWMYPDSADSYLDLIQAIDRSQFGAHLDPVNVICSPQRYFDNAGLLREWFAKLGPYIKSCHAKDILLQDKLTVHLDEVCPGRGYLDYRTFLLELAKIDPDTPLLLEHMHKEEDYLAGASYIRSIAKQIGVTV
ncbi:MAG: sugar phosphate isomerase/epimerase [Anaerolineae bacterium]|nr:sugar phosphate isomerase/epimerase [Anaerolineae bacterium]